MTRYAVDNHERLLRIVCGFSVVAVLVAKVPLIWRININWDEFYFLSHVHSLARGELALLLQGAYTHLFIWVTRLNLDEVGQIDFARLAMWPFLVLSCVLLFRLSRRWASATGAWLAVIAFVTSWPVMVHGASLRADSLLLPLTLATFLLASDGAPRSPGRDVGTGFFLGLALVLTIKAILMLPALMAVLWFEVVRKRSDSKPIHFHFLRRLAPIALTGSVTAALILAVHANFVTGAAEQPKFLVARALSGAIFDMPLVPRWHQFLQLLDNDALGWILLTAGLAVAIVRRKYGAAACALSLLPIVCYRNAYPYYYVVMLAPASVVIALLIDEIQSFSVRAGRAAAGIGVTSIILLLLLHDSWNRVMTLRFDEQSAQRSVIAAVHRIFPTPVPYIDHSGMISSFPKVNFFMSSWGIELYVAGGKDFMPGILAAHRPPLLLVNHFALVPKSLEFRKLSPTDQLLIREFYIEYWGPVRVAGIERVVPSGGIVSARLPFAGAYRIESDAPILIDGKRYDTGDQIVWHADSRDLRLQAVTPGSKPLRVRIFSAAAQAPPKERPPKRPLYLGL